MTDFARYQCWQTSRVTEVINKEAISVDIADFMATHAPLGQIAQIHASSLSTMSEADVLAELARSTRDDRHVFAVVEGEPGTGKSHLIRWLHQRYLAERDGQDEVLLIERAQNSLLGTLRQIIERIDIGSVALRQQIEKLRGAADSLSARAMQDTLINNLAIATYEREPSSKAKIKRGIERFLLDPVVREALKAEGGPVERIARFLTSGRRPDDGSQPPQFFAGDFDLRVETLREIRMQGYTEARDLAEALNLKPELREDLAAYLNTLLDYAITRTVMLSPDDLKQTFNDLRRELRNRGKGLALFIEDITAFTGIDLGLIDVLATQHTGAGNLEFCRIISIVGLTDYYFNKTFPTNLQQRVTHRLSLNLAVPGQSVGGLLPNSAAAADMVGRYLNAMRAERDDVQRWHAAGGQIEQLPNRCDGCPFREPCHSAFGSVNIGAGGTEAQVGLYPFNERAIWNIYRRLDEITIAKTPRALLNYVVLDVLQRHGPQVAAGTFPPPAKELAAGVRDMPALVKPVQQRIINDQGRADAQRIQTLALYWGDGTIDARGEGASRTVGGLSDMVYHAFAIAPIAGASASDPIVPPIIDIEPSEKIEPDTTVTPPDSGVGRLFPPRPPANQRQGTRFDADLANWRAGGRLENYEKLRELLVEFIKNGISWELYGIPNMFVDERIRNPRFEIEGQTGLGRGDRLILPRSDELADVLQALAELSERGSQIAQDALGAHLVTLSAWLHTIEPLVVDFALKPTSAQPAPIRIVELLLLDCLLIEWLCDGLKNDSTAQELLGAVVASAARETGDRPLKDQEWAALVERAAKVHSPFWAGTLRQIGIKRAQSCRRGLARMLNLPQGGSSDVRYIDAALGLQIVSAMTKRDWELTAIPPIDKGAEPIWADAGAVYQTLLQRAPQVLADEKAFLQAKLDRLIELRGDAQPDEIVKAVERLLTAMSTYNKPHSLEVPPLKATGFKITLQYLATTIEQKSRAATAIRTSAGARYVDQMEDMLRYLANVEKITSRMIEQTDRQIEQYGVDNAATRLEEQTVALYDEIIDLLREPAAVEEVER
jgi:hypothetical protein